MTRSDRAFRALAHAEPEVLLATLRALAPQLVPRGATVRMEDMSATRQDALAPPEDADSVMLVGDDELVHTEGQLYATVGGSVIEGNIRRERLTEEQT